MIRQSCAYWMLPCAIAISVFIQSFAIADSPVARGGPTVVASQTKDVSLPTAQAATKKSSYPILTIVRPLTIAMFLIFIGMTLMFVYRAAGRTKTPAYFYVADSAISGPQNGWALAGDYMSAASFLGIAGLISLYGYDGLLYSGGWLVAYVTLHLIVAEPCRNSGRYTIGDILSFRSFPIPVWAMAAISTVTVSTFYLIAQMVGAGKLMELLLGAPFKISIMLVGALMIIYVVFGTVGMPHILMRFFTVPTAKEARKSVIVACS